MTSCWAGTLGGPSGDMSDVIVGGDKGTLGGMGGHGDVMGVTQEVAGSDAGGATSVPSPQDTFAVARQLNLVAPVCQWAELPPEPRLFRHLGRGGATERGGAKERVGG